MADLDLNLDGFRWVDIVNPSLEVLHQAANDLGLSKRVLVNCLSSDYLPHVESYGDTQFVLLRFMEPTTRINANSVQELTTKIALFISKDKIYSFHRLPLAEIKKITEKLNSPEKAAISKIKLLSLFFEQMSLGFDDPLTELEQKLQNFEERMFAKKKSQHFLQEGFYLKRKSSALKKVLRLSLEAMNRLVLKMDCGADSFQEARDRLERSLFYAEDVVENIQSLMSLHMAIESQKTNEGSFRTNEIMRVLTVLTIFFLPLNFIAGVFGINFAHIPYLQHEWGFWISVLLMVLVSTGLAVFLYYQGWLARPKIREEDESHQFPS